MKILEYRDILLAIPELTHVFSVGISMGPVLLSIEQTDMRSRRPT